MHKFCHKFCRQSIAFGGLLLLGPAALPAAPPVPRYAVTDLGTLPGGQASRATALNDRGQVVGSSTRWAAGISTTHAFLWENGMMRDIDSLPAQAKVPGTRACAINSRGEVVGDVWPQLTGQAPSTASGSSAQYQVVDILYADAGWRCQNGKMQIIGAPAVAINDKGEALLSGYRQSRIWRGGKARNVPPVPGFQFVTATALNNHDDLAGYCANDGGNDQAFVRLPVQTSLLGTLPGQNTSRAVAMNDAGQVIGISSDEFYIKGANTIGHGTRSSRAFFWQDGKLTDLGDREVSGLGAQGQVVGSYFPSTAPNKQVALTAFLWQDGQFTDLDTLIDKSAGWKLEDAEAVNKRGQIVGYGEHNGRQRAFLLTPTVSDSR